MLGWWGIVVLALAGFQVEGNIAGSVQDESRAVVVGASVVVRNQETGAVRETATNERGDYAMPLLAPGVYQLTVEKPGFRRGMSSNIRLNVGEALRLDLTLAVGDIQTTIEILEAVPFLQTDTSALGQVIDDIKISELPLNERNFLHFTLLVPGAQPPADGSQNSSEFIGGAISVNGAREQSNNFLLDGIDNNGMLINQYSVLPSVDAIREFKVQSGNSSAEYGRSGGAQINIILKSGANQFHGSAFEFLRNRKLDAKNFFDPPACASTSIQGTCGEIPRFDRNQFGATLGGPIQRDKTFFFGSYEGLRLRQAVTRRATVPSQVQRQAALSSLPALIRNPAGEAILNLYPRANVGPDLATSNTFVASPVARNTVNQALGKIDHQLTKADSISGHYAFYETKRFDPYALLNPFTNLPGFGSNKDIESHSGRATWTRILNSRWINEARAGFNRRAYTFRNENSGIDKAKAVGFPTISPRSVDWGYPNVTIPGFDGIGESIVLPQDSIETTVQFADSVAWNPAFDGGRHSFKFGTDYRYQKMDLFLDVYSRGNWFFLGVVTGNPLQDLLLGAPTFALASTGDTNTLQRTNALNFYFQDDYRVSSRLTVNMGLRYEYNSPAVETRDQFTVPDFSAKSLTCSPKPDCQFIRAGTNGVSRSTYDRDLNNFAPRIGFAWKPFGNRFVVRSAYGLFYDVAILNRSVFPRLNPPFFGINVFVNNGRNSIQDLVNQPVPSPPQVGMIDPNTRDAYMQHWNLDLQHEIARDFAIDIAYVGSKGSKLAKHIDFNEAPPGAARPYPQFGPIRYITAGASSSYNGLQLRAEKRFSRGLTFLSAYTWSKSIDDASALFGSAGEPSIPQDSHNLGGERALSDFHSAHRFVLSYLQEIHLLGNWQLGAIWTMQSGRPFTINRAIDQSGTGTDLDFSDRPDQIADPDRAGPVANNPDPLCRITISQGGRAADVVHDARSWFNPCAFAAPVTARFGTAGRNSVIGPDFKNVDFSVTRKFSFKESRSLETRVEFFNIFNHPNFDIPNRVFDSPTFGAVQSSNAFGTRPSRQIQIGLRYVF